MSCVDIYMTNKLEVCIYVQLHIRIYTCTYCTYLTCYNDKYLSSVYDIRYILYVLDNRTYCKHWLIWPLICSKLDFHNSHVFAAHPLHACSALCVQRSLHTLEARSTTPHRIEYDDDNDNEDECQDNGHNDDPHGNLCTWWRRSERRYDGDSGLHGVLTEGRRECLR